MLFFFSFSFLVHAIIFIKTNVNLWNYMKIARERMNMGCLFLSLSIGHIPTAHGDTTADPAPDHGPIITDLTVGPTAESVGAEATAIHPCPIVGGTLATVYVLSNV